MKYLGMRLQVPYWAYCRYQDTLCLAVHLPVLAVKMLQLPDWDADDILPVPYSLDKKRSYTRWEKARMSPSNR